ncbi:DUF2225 domain-containing protein [Salinispira pacifica]|uniref:DUF2225 domain-containing protein n=1 Tax=Salinispira pacifica TaxID=1307761 RepID=V5WKP6_9SPIO|nr:DUF2225 domain-containing protein [Salinispira pacifica]AHC15766.1 hypothetical protein L21SP2_2413 [Salinispira pacifica]
MAEKTPSLTYFQKKPISCPVCQTEFYREELLTGRGRLIAGNLTQELRRLYEPSKKFGEVIPLAYPVTVCPSCYFAAWKEDFLKISESQLERAADETSQRIQWVSEVMEGVDFRGSRGLSEGLASYMLAVLCYDYFPSEVSPVMKQGVSSLRGAWLALDMHKKYPEDHFDYLAKMLYRKARFFYLTAIEYESSGKQGIGGCPNPGPDLDKNYMFDGVLYIYGYLEFHYGPRKDPVKREENLKRAKRTIARIFGMGRASKNKPQAILDNARDLYSEIGEALGLENLDPEKDSDNQ